MFSPSGRSDVYWADGKLQVGDSCCYTEQTNVTKIPTRFPTSHDLSDSIRIIKLKGGIDKTVDIRYYVTDKWGEKNATKIGIELTHEECSQLLRIAGVLSEELEKEMEGWHPLSGNTLVRIGRFDVPADGTCFGVNFSKAKEKKEGDALKIVPCAGKFITLAKEEWVVFLEEMEKSGK